MAKHILSRIDKDRKVKFDQKQLATVISLLNSIIGKEKDKTVKNNFKSIKAIFIGTYPNLYALKQAAMGLKTLLSKTSKLLAEDVQKDKKANLKKRAVKKIITAAMLVLSATISLASCAYNINYDADYAYDTYGAALVSRSSDLVYTVMVEQTTINALEKALKSYNDTGDTSGLGDMDIKVTTDVESDLAAQTDHSGNIRIKPDTDKEYWQDILTHELAHRKQFSMGIEREAGINGSALGYNINPMEVNANFNAQYWAVLRNQPTPGGNTQQYVALMLTYRPEYFLNSEFTDVIRKIQDRIKERDEVSYKIYQALSKDKKGDKIKDFFLHNVIPDGVYQPNVLINAKSAKK